MAKKELRKPTMTGKEYKAALKSLGLSQRTGGEFLDFSTRQSRRIANDHATISLAAEMLLRTMLYCGLTPKAVADMTATPAKPKKAAKAKKEAAATA